MSLTLRYENCREGQFAHWNYRIEDQWGRVLYCGSTINPEQRRIGHASYGSQAIQKHIRAHPDQAFFMIVHDGDNDPDGDPCAAREQHYMDHWDTLDLGPNPDPMKLNRAHARWTGQSRPRPPPEDPAKWLVNQWKNSPFCAAKVWPKPRGKIISMARRDYP